MIDSSIVMYTVIYIASNYRRYIIIITIWALLYNNVQVIQLIVLQLFDSNY